MLLAYDVRLGPEARTIKGKGEENNGRISLPLD